MNSTPQLDFHTDSHPDCDSLNAFAEQALSGPERARVLDHLAGCSRCRQVLFLAQQAAGEPGPATVPPARSAARPNRWFDNWRLVWIPAAALVAIAALAVFMHLRPTPPASQFARVAPQQPGTLSNASVRQTPATAPGPRSVAMPAARKAASAEPRVSSAEPNPEALPLPQPAAETAAIANVTAEYEAAPAPRPAAQGFQAARGPAPPGLQNSLQNNTQQVWPDHRLNAVDALSTTAKATQTRFNPSPNPAQTASSGALTTAPVRQMERKLAPAATFAMAAAPSLHGTGSAHGAEALKLPSGLGAISTATAQHHMLAVDPAGTLFLSEDSGASWEPVPRQWSGQALYVRAKQPPAAKAAFSASPAPIFELVNDSSLTWVSLDGKTWNAQ